eukprot:scaffold3785_cov115-Isochrysis_galbana.AAC.3
MEGNVHKPYRADTEACNLEGLRLRDGAHLKESAAGEDAVEGDCEGEVQTGEAHGEVEPQGEDCLVHQHQRDRARNVGKRDADRGER